MLIKGVALLMSNLQSLLDQSNIKVAVEDFKRFGSARKLYNFSIDNAY